MGKNKTVEVLNVNASYLCDLLRAVVVPVMVFGVVNYLRAWDMHYSSNTVSVLLCILVFVVFTLCTLSIDFHVGRLLLCRASLPKPRFRLASFVFVTCVIAWVAGFALGDYNFHQNVESYYDITSLNKYPAIDPSVYHGQQFMDGGQFEFVAGSHLDLRKSYGFKNGHVYCVAPIVASHLNGSTKNQNNYDFWAVGLDCCSGHTNDYHCGEYGNPKATKGLRLMRDADRNFYRLAVKEATASYGIEATFPIFMTWMERPEEELQAHYAGGCFNFLNSIVGFTVLQFVLVIFAALFLNMKHPAHDAEHGAEHESGRAMDASQRYTGYRSV